MSSQAPIAVVGAGTMGRGVAQLAAQCGHPVLLYDAFPDALAGAREALAEVLATLERKGRLGEPASAVLERLRFTDTLSDLADAAWIVEAVPEDLDLKRQLFAELERVAPRAFLATNTSTLSVTRIAAATTHPERVVGVHFFNPAPLMRLIEVVPGLDTAPEVVEGALALARGLGKTPVVAADRPGFIVNRVARPFYGEALKLAGEGVAPADIDRVMRGLGFRMGPFELLDLIGLDVNLAATRSVHEAFFGEPRYRPHPLQQRMVDAGRLGRKSGRGFYRYPRDDREAAPPAPTGTPEGEPPRALLLGDGPLASALERRLPTTRHPAEATLVLDTRVEGGTLPDAISELPVAALQWSRSASLARARLARPLVGFSLVPPLADAPVVELYPPLSGEGGEREGVRAYFEAGGLTTLTLPDQPGGVGFRILAMLVNEAVGAVAEGLASTEAIDTAMRLGTNYPHGPLEWSERIGLGAVLAGLDGLFGELGEERYRPHPLLRRAVAAGLERLPSGGASAPG